MSFRDFEEIGIDLYTSYDGNFVIYKLNNNTTDWIVKDKRQEIFSPGISENSNNIKCYKSYIVKSITDAFNKAAELRNYC